MPTKSYLAVVDRAPGEANWSITFPSLPAVTSAAATFADALASFIEDLQLDGDPLPPAVEDDTLPDFNRTGFHDPRLLFIDTISRRTGLSRSSLLAKRARMVIATETGG